MALGLGQRDRLAERVAGADESADLELVVEAGGSGRSRAPRRPAGSVWPLGRRTGVPLTTIDDARPW